jgi:hypothetical protein
VTTTIKTNSITLHVHILNDGDHRWNFPWQWVVTRGPDLHVWNDGKPQISHPDVLQWGNCTSRISAIWFARRWCRRYALRERSPRQVQKFTYTATWDES